MNHRHLWPALIIALCVAGCGRNSSLLDFFTSQDEVSEQQTNAPRGLALSPYYEAQQAAFTKGPNRDGVDLMITYDHTGSMKAFNVVINRDINTLIDSLRARGIDFRIGVLRAAEINSQGEHVLKLQLPNRIITSSQPDANDLLRQNFSALDASYEGGNSELPMMVTMQAARNHSNHDFYRTNSVRAFLVLSDYTGELGFYNTADLILSYFTGTAPTLPWVFSALGSPSNHGCNGAEERIMPVVESVAKQSGGRMGRICDGSQIAFFNEVAQSIAVSLTELTLYPWIITTGQVVADDSIRLEVNGTAIARDSATGFQFNAAKQSISFPGSYQPLVGDSIVVNLEFRYD